LSICITGMLDQEYYMYVHSKSYLTAVGRPVESHSGALKHSCGALETILVGICKNLKPNHDTSIRPRYSQACRQLKNRCIVTGD